MARPRKDERIDIRSRAIDETARLCAARGIDEVTLQDIAAAVGCRPPALYRYFPNKEALLLEVHDEGFRRLYARKRAAAAAAGGDALDRLRRGGEAYVRFALANPDLYALMFSHPGPQRRLAALKAAGDVEAVDFARRSLDFLEASVRACQAEGYLAAVDAATAAFTFWSVVHGAVSLGLRRSIPLDGDAQAIALAAVDTVMALVAASRHDAR